MAFINPRTHQGWSPYRSAMITRRIWAAAVGVTVVAIAVIAIYAVTNGRT